MANGARSGGPHAPGGAEKLDEKRYWRYAEQLRAAALSVPNNIAEGSGSVHQKEFLSFLNIARRSLFETASMLLVFSAMDVLQQTDIQPLLVTCDKLSRMIYRLAQSKGLSDQ